MTGPGASRSEHLFESVARKPSDDAAWAELYTALWPVLCDWVLSRYGLNPAEAQDVLQDSLLQYRAKLRSREIEKPSLPHLRAFVKFSVLTLLRAQARLTALDEIAGTAAAADNPEQDLLNKLMVDEALDRLDGRCAFVLRARYYQGKTSAEIAAALKLGPGSVDVLLHRCRARCREILGSFPP
jgi:RNA polymerase sigma factor (sigma-70 family)